MGWDEQGTGFVLRSDVKKIIEKRREKRTLIGKLLDIPRQVFQFIWSLLLVRIQILKQKDGTLRF